MWIEQRTRSKKSSDSLTINEVEDFFEWKANLSPQFFNEFLLAQNFNRSQSLGFFEF